MSKIQTIAGTWDDTCTYESDLAANALKEPVFRQIMEYAEPRMLSTLIVSGAKSPWDLQSGRTDVVKTKIAAIPKDKLIGDSAMRYRVMGRIQKECIINGLVSQSTTTGDFALSVSDQYLYPGMVVSFWYPGLQARVQSVGVGGGTTFTYQFRTLNNQPFVYATHVAPQPGTKTLFGQYTTYGEESQRGYDRSHYPDEFINHLTTQRKAIKITGDALNQVLRVTFNGATGWYYEKLRQAKIRFLLEDEFQKWFGQSTMKDANGNLLAQSTLIDNESGLPVTAGDGVWEQIRGGNEAYTSGINGAATIEDFADMMSVLEKNSDSIYGKTWYVITGTDGYGVAQDLLRDYWVNFMGGRVNQANGGANTAGGEDITVGGNFDSFNYRGNKLIFCKHPMWDDAKRFNNYRSINGELIQSGSYLFLDAGVGVGGGNMEILTKGAYGQNRSMIMHEFDGMPSSGKPVSPVDAKVYEMLKQDGIFVYNTTSCGILHRSIS